MIIHQCVLYALLSLHLLRAKFHLSNRFTWSVYPHHTTSNKYYTKWWNILNNEYNIVGQIVCFDKCCMCEPSYSNYVNALLSCVLLVTFIPRVVQYCSFFIALCSPYAKQCFQSKFCWSFLTANFTLWLVSRFWFLNSN